MKAMYQNSLKKHATKTKIQPLLLASSLTWLKIDAIKPLCNQHLMIRIKHKDIFQGKQWELKADEVCIILNEVANIFMLGLPYPTQKIDKQPKMTFTAKEKLA